MPRKVLLRTTDVAAAKAVRKDDSGAPLLSWPLSLNERYGTASIDLTTDAPRPRDDDYIEITAADGVTRVFSGLVKMPELRDETGERARYSVEAQGFGAVLDRVVLTAAISWVAGTPDRKMVEDVLALYYGPIATGITHLIRNRRADMPAVSFYTGTTIRSVLDGIAAEAWNAPWNVDADKRVNYNYFPAAPYVLWAPATTTTALKALDSATHASIESYSDHGDSTQQVLRVRVVGTAVEYTATDWVGVARVSRRLADEPNAPTARFWQAVDVNDTTLTTVEQCKQRGFAELAAGGPRRTHRCSVVRDGFAPGQVVDVVNEQVGPETAPLMRWGKWRSDSGKQLRLGQGRFVVQRVDPEPLTDTDTRYRLTLGSHEKALAQIVARG